MADHQYFNPNTHLAPTHENTRNVNNASPMTYDDYRTANTHTPTAYDNYPVSPTFDQPGGRGLAPEDEIMLQEADVHWRGVAKPMRLGRATVMCLIFNRMIGTGIFRTPAVVYNYTQSIGVSMAWWALGAVSAIAGILVYMELGLTIPLYKFGDTEISVPRSGGELNYLKYIFKRPAFLTTCVFGIAFILLGHVAMNAIAFGTSILDATGQSDNPNHNAIVRGIALGTAAACCLIHATWRQGGIYLNNVLAVFKVAVLLLIFILAMCAVGKVFPPATPLPLAATTTPLPKADAYTYAESFLSILFAFGGLNQANYVIGEVDDPRRRYKWPAFSAVVIVSVLYLLVNAAYFIVVPTSDFAASGLDTAISGNVAHRLFVLTLGSLSPAWEARAPQMLSAFMAVSSLGNIIVMTYTAARVKQEIAKEGILPLRRFLASSVKSFRIPVRRLWGSKRETLPEDVPLGALFLHFALTTILILATWQLTVANTYAVLVDLYSYTIDAVFGTVLGFGLVYMRLFSARDWAAHSRASGFRVPAAVSVAAAAVFGIANLYPVAAKWVPPDAGTALPVPWFTTGVVGSVIMAAGTLWWVGFRWVVPRVGRAHVGRVLLVTRKLWFTEEVGYKVLEYEDVEFRWVTREMGGEAGKEGEIGGGGEGRLWEREVHAGPQEVEARMRSDNMGNPAGEGGGWPHEMM